MESKIFQVFRNQLQFFEKSNASNSKKLSCQGFLIPEKLMLAMLLALGKAITVGRRKSKALFLWHIQCRGHIVSLLIHAAKQWLNGIHSVGQFIWVIITFCYFTHATLSGPLTACTAFINIILLSFLSIFTNPWIKDTRIDSVHTLKRSY